MPHQYIYVTGVHLKPELYSHEVWVGLGFGIALLPFIVTIGNYFDKRKSIAVSISVCGVGVGTIVCAPLLEVIIEHYGWRGTVLILGGVVLNIIVIGALLKPFDKRRYMLTQDKFSKFKKENIDKGTKQDITLATNVERLYSFENGNITDKEAETLLLQNGSILSKKNGSLQIETHNDVNKNKGGSCLGSFSKHYDFSIFRNYSFVLFLVSNFFVMLGMTCPLIYLPDRAIEKGCTKSESATFISIIGFSNIFGRLFVGCVADRPCVSRRLLYIISMVLIGGVTIANPLNNSVAYLMAYSAIFGCFMGLFYCLFVIVLMDLVTINQLGNATGVLLLVHGVASSLGPSAAGWIYNISGNYEFSFYAIGGVMLIGGLTMCFVSTERRSVS